MGAERANFKSIERWSAYLEELHAHIAHRFLRAEVRQRAYRYLTGLLADVRRKNSWQRTLGKWPKPSARRDQEGYNTSSMTLVGTQTPCATTCVSTSWNTSQMREAGYSSSMRPAS